MLFGFDLWHKGWGFGFTLILWERFEEPLGLQKVDLEWEVKLFGKRWGTGE